jgi:hypothetical protein
VPNKLQDELKVLAIRVLAFGIRRSKSENWVKIIHDFFKFNFSTCLMNQIVPNGRVKLYTSNINSHSPLVRFGRIGEELKTGIRLSK